MTESQAKGNLSWGAGEESWHSPSAFCFTTRGLGAAAAVARRQAGGEERAARGNVDARCLLRASGSFWSEGGRGTLKAPRFWLSGEMLQELRRKVPGAGSRAEGPAGA